MLLPLWSLLKFVSLMEPTLYKNRIQNRMYPFLYMWFCFREYSQFTRQKRKGGEAISLTPFYNFHALRRRLDISRAITAGSSPLHIVSSRTRTGPFGFQAHVPNH